jgi:hypothetical protein
MKLSSINRVLRWFGLVLVVAVPDGDCLEGNEDTPIRLWIERWLTFERRCRAQAML